MTHDDERVLKEERQAAAMRRVADLSAQRAEALRHAEALLDALGDAVVDAVRQGAPRRRTQDLAQVSPPTFYKWLEDAGVAIRSRKGSKRHWGTPPEKDEAGS